MSTPFRAEILTLPYLTLAYLTLPQFGYVKVSHIPTKKSPV